MRQVPKYLIIGRGRLARHFSEYFRLLEIDYLCWNRGDESPLADVLGSSEFTDILLLISDDQILDFYRKHLQDVKRPVYHCSGSVLVDGAFAVHPLMTFSSELYDLEFYKGISFISLDGSNGLPALPNKVKMLSADQRKRYHMLCVLGGNFSQILWSKVASEFEKMGLPRELLLNYAMQSTKNIIEDPSSLTGPLVRGDMKVIDQHRKSLSGDDWLEIYDSFVEVFHKEAQA